MLRKKSKAPPRKETKGKGKDTANSNNASGDSSRTSGNTQISSTSINSKSGNDLKRKSLANMSHLTTFEVEEQPKSESEIEKRFLSVVDSMALPNKDARDRFMAQFQSPSSKWMMIQMHAKASATLQSTIGDVKHYLERLETQDITFEQLQGLAVELRTQTLDWMKEFIRLNGIYHLNVLLVSTCGILKHNAKGDEFQAECVSCLYSILNTTFGTNEFLKSEDSVRTLVFVLSSENIKTKKTVLLILASLCHQSDDALKLTIDAFSNYRLVKREDHRFETLVKSLKFSQDSEYKTRAMMFLNTLLNAPQEMSLRKEIQQEMINLRVLDILKEMYIVNPDLQTQKRIFEEEMSSKDTRQRLSDPVDIVKVMKLQLPEDSQVHLLNTLNNMLAIANTENETCIRHNFSILDSVVNFALSFTDDDGKLKNLEVDFQLLQDKISALQSSLSNLHRDIDREQDQLKDFMEQSLSGKQQSKPSSDSFDVLKDMFYSISSMLFQHHDLLDRVRELEEEVKRVIEAKEIAEAKSVQEEKGAEQKPEEVLQKSGDAEEEKDHSTTIEETKDYDHAKEFTDATKVPDIDEYDSGEEEQQQAAGVLEEPSKEVETEMQKPSEEKRELQKEPGSAPEKIETVKMESVPVVDQALVEKVDDLEKQIEQKKQEYEELSTKYKHVLSQNNKFILEIDKEKQKLQESKTLLQQTKQELEEAKELANSAASPSTLTKRASASLKKLRQSLSGRSFSHMLQNIPEERLGDSTPAPPTSAPAPPPPPPPPGAPGTPPPPPLPGMAGGMPGSSLPSLPTDTPSGKMRQFNLDSISKSKAAKSLFMKKGLIDDLKGIPIDKDMDQLFAVAEKKINIKSAAGGASNGEPRQPQVQSLLDSKRSYNISLQLMSLRMDFNSIKDAVIKMDDDTIGGKLNVLKAIAPTEEEIEMVNSYDGDVQFLAEPDKFFLKMSDVDSLRSRIDTWSFKLRFEQELSTLRPDVESILLATKELKDGKRFHSLLAIVLRLSNYLNAKSRLKNTYGFRVSTLLKLKDTKTADTKSNLLEYLIQYIQKHDKFSDLLTFHEDMTNVSAAKKCGLSAVNEGMGGIRKGITQVSKLLSRYEEDNSLLLPGDQYVGVMRAFLDDAMGKFSELEARFEEVTEQLAELAELYDEDKNAMAQKPEDFFDRVDRFLAMFKEAHEHLLQVKKRQERARSRPGTIGSNVLGKSPTDTMSGPGLLDNMEQKLRDGSGFRKRTEQHPVGGGGGGGGGIQMGQMDMQGLLAGLRRTGKSLK